MDLPSNLYGDMKRLLGAANERMEMLKRRGYMPQTQNPVSSSPVSTSPSVPKPVVSPKPASSGNSSQHTTNSTAEQVHTPSSKSQTSIRYEYCEFPHHDA